MRGDIVRQDNGLTVFNLLDRESLSIPLPFDRLNDLFAAIRSAAIKPSGRKASIPTTSLLHCDECYELTHHIQSDDKVVLPSFFRDRGGETSFLTQLATIGRVWYATTSYVKAYGIEVEQEEGTLRVIVGRDSSVSSDKEYQCIIESCGVISASTDRRLVEQIYRNLGNFENRTRLWIQSDSKHGEVWDAAYIGRENILALQ